MTASRVDSDGRDRTDGLSHEQLASEQAAELPDREAMSILSVGGLTGAFPIPADVPPPVSLPEPPTMPPGVPTDVDLTNAGGNVGDISDVTDVRSLTDDLDLQDLTNVSDISAS